MAIHHAPAPAIGLITGIRNTCLRLGFLIIATWPLLLSAILLRALL